MSGRPHILWLARHLPVPLNSGDCIYTARLVEALGRAGADVHFLGLANPEYPDMKSDGLDPSVRWEIIPGKPRSPAVAMFSTRPLVGARFGIAAYAARIAECLATGDYDTIVIDQYGMAWTLPLIERHVRAGRPKIVHIAHDFETDVTRGIAAGYRGNPVRKLALYLNARRTAAAERKLAASSDLIVTLTKEDRELFAGIGATGDFLVVPPGYDGPRRADHEIGPQTPRQVGIVGSYRWIAKQMNLAAFLDSADPILAAAGIELLVVGDVPDDFLARWQGKLRASRFLGFVDDLAAFLDSCRMGLIVEAIGGGFKLKVLDYVLTRTPVAALAPALGGQEPSVVEHFLICEDAGSLAHAIVEAIDQFDRLNAMQDGAYRAALPLYDWGSNGRRLLAAMGFEPVAD
jgi:glycosyltransferase involved in cell wall biosynthesis